MFDRVLNMPPSCIKMDGYCKLFLKSNKFMVESYTSKLTFRANKCMVESHTNKLTFGKKLTNLQTKEMFQVTKLKLPYGHLTSKSNIIRVIYL